MAKNFPDFGAKPLQPSDLKAMYIPVWFIDGEASAMVTCLGEEVRGVEIVQMGHSLTPA